MAIDPNSLPQDSETLRKTFVDLAEQLDRSLAEQNKYQSLVRELLEAQRNRKSVQLSKAQLALFEAAWNARSAEAESAADDGDDLDGDAGSAGKANTTPTPKRGGGQPLARHLKRERIVHDLTEAEEHCDPLYRLMKNELLNSKVIGTDDTSVKVLDRKLPFARKGRIWPCVGDTHHPVMVYDYTPTRSRAGPAKFLEGYKGYLDNSTPHLLKCRC